jgi:single-stranded DNA-specific DHH superfamily exonuclease
MWKVSAKELEKLRDFLDIRGKKILFYHRDCDGVCSAALWLRFFPDFDARPREGPRMDSGFVRHVIDQDPDLLVFLDLPVDQEWKRIGKMLESLPDTRILVIDHHIVEKDLNSGRILHINPKFKHEIYLPAAFLVYRILKGLEEGVEELDWIAALGIVGDYGFEDCRDFLDAVGIENLDRGVELVSAAITLKGLKGADIVLKLLLASDSYREFLRTKTLGLWKKYVDREFKEVISNFKKEKEEYKDANLVIYIIKGRLNFTSVVATYFSERFQDKVILISKKGKDGWKLSVRNQSGKFNVGDLVKKCVKGIGSGGGHKKAAGGIVKDFEKFKRRLLAELEAGS